MKNREFLIWIYARLVHVHGDEERIASMHHFRAIIKDMDKDKETINTGLSKNSLEEMLEGE